VLTRHIHYASGTTQVGTTTTRAAASTREAQRPKCSARPARKGWNSRRHDPRQRLAQPTMSFSRASLCVISASCRVPSSNWQHQVKWPHVAEHSMALGNFICKPPRSFGKVKRAVDVFGDICQAEGFVPAWCCGL